MARWRLIAEVAGVATGVIAAGAGVVLAAEKIAVGRQRMRPDPEAAEPLGELRGRPLTVLAGDGAALHAEIDGPDDAPVTVIFCHGYALNQDIWHYQRRDLADLGRLVFWDQRGHGRSGRAGHGTGGSPGPVSIGQLGEDLYAVLRATTPGPAPVVLVGHSMGGMTIMALAADHPELFGTKVIGTVLISTAATAVDPAGWLPAPVRLAARQAAVPVLRGVARGRPAAMVERLRSSAGDLAFLSTRQLAFSDPGISPAVVDFLEQMIRATRIGVVADFYLALLAHDQQEALATVGRVPSAVITGDRDRLIGSLGESLASGIPGARLILLPETGHVPMLERPGAVTEAIAALVAEARQAGPGQPAPRHGARG
ncbi:MAG TPA: alpha/beta hydrolase [Streptosporangiaceae bacterium]